MKIKSSGQNVTSIYCEGSHGQISRAVVLTKKKKEKEEVREDEEQVLLIFINKINTWF